MKKAVAILLAAILLLSVITTTFAATPIISFGKATFTTKGEKQTLVIEARDLDSVSVIQFTVKYDKTKVKLLNVAPSNSTTNFYGEVIDAAKNGIIPDATVNGKTSGEVVVVWESTQGIKEDGILVELQFEALVANAGEIKLELDKTQDFLVCKDNSNGVPSVNVQVETTNDPLAVYGDVNGDGKITSYDASLILQYVVGNIGENALDINAADVDGNGKITSYDASLILQFVVGNISEFPKG